MCMKEGLKKASQVASKGSSDEIRVTYFCQLLLLSRVASVENQVFWMSNFSAY